METRTKLLIGSGVVLGAFGLAYAASRSASAGEGGSDEGGGEKVRRPVLPNPQDAKWSSLRSMAIMSVGDQWRFAAPDEAKRIFAVDQPVTLGITTSNGPMTMETEVQENGAMSLVPRVGPTVSYSADSGVLTLFSAEYHGPFSLLVGTTELQGWFMSGEGEQTERGASFHYVDKDLAGRWSMYAEARDIDGKLLRRTNGYFETKDEALEAGDRFIDTQGAKSPRELLEESQALKEEYDAIRRELEEIKKEEGIA